MFVFIGGILPRTKIVDEGEFPCPRDGQTQRYQRKRTNHWLTLFFLPIFPVGKVEEFVECSSCGTRYDTGVLVG